MPEVFIALRWPDGSTQRCTSPSTAIEHHLATGASYPLDEFVRRARDGFAAASARVREVHGFACAGAATELEAIDRRAAACKAGRGRVLVEAVRRDPGPPARAELRERHDVVIVGAGHAGLAVSWWLRQRGVEHVVLERDRVAHTWLDERWADFCLVTPNWQCQLPGHPYDGPDPDGFMLRDEIVDYVRRYAERFAPPVCEGVAVTRVEPAGDDGYVLRTTAGPIAAGQVVFAIGGYHRVRLPEVAAGIDPAVTQLHSSAYPNPSALPDGAVLVVGSGQSGAQIAEDLHIAGREVHLSVGSAPRVARRHRGRDVVAWLQDLGHYDLPVDEHPEGTGARREPNHYVTGRGGGHDIDLRAMAADGLTLHGRLAAADGAVLRFAGDLPASLDNADDVYRRINATIDRWIDEHGVDAPPAAPYEAGWTPDGDGSAPLDLRAEGVTSIVWATGFGMDWSWVDALGFGDDGHPDHDRGVTSAPGLYVVGLPWLHTWGSGRFAAVGRDAEHVTHYVEEHARFRARCASTTSSTSAATG